VAEAKRKKRAKKGTRLADLTDEEVVGLWEGHGCNAQALASELGVSRSTVTRRLDRIRMRGGVTLPETGQEIVVAAQTAQPKSQGEREKLASNLDTLGRLESCIEHIDKMAIAVLAEVEKQGGKYKPFQIDQMLKIVREVRGVTESAFQIKIKLYDKAAMDAFIEAVIRVIEKQVPDVQRQLFIELSRLGLEGQVAGRD